MHPSVMAYVTEIVAKYDLGNSADVLEVGSNDVNGSVRGLFRGDYLGVDEREGKGVDQVMSGNDMPFSRQFDVVVSTEMLEHDRFPWRSIAQMGHALRNRGYLIVTARGFDDRGTYPCHDTRDLWRFTVEGLAGTVEDTGYFRVLDARPDPEFPGVLLTAMRTRP